MQSRKPNVGISLCIDRGKRWRPGYDYLYVNRAYAEQVHTAGGVPLLLGVDIDPSDALSVCDGVILTGGDDLPTTRDELDVWCQGHAPRNAAGGTAESGGTTTTSEAPGSAPNQGEAHVDTLGEQEDVGRIVWERGLIDAAATADKPLLGICYGMQLMNLHHGGSLLRDVRSEHAGALDHGGSGRVTRHGVSLVGQSVLLGAIWPTVSAALGAEINSSHGQAILGVAPGFSVTARAEDGVIEAIESELAYGVEWHPEMDATGAALFRRFVELCGG